MVKQCLFCGRYFTPDYRVKDKQKACADPACRAARKKAAQKTWCDRNPGYFHGRYLYVKGWRRKKRVIQDEIPPRESYVELILRIPDKKKRMIQDEISLRRVGRRTFAAYGYS